MKPNKKGEKKYRCTKCGKVFNIGHEVTVEGALCNECFDQLLKLNTAKDYFFYKKVIMKPNKIKEKFRKWFWRDAIHAREDFYTHEGKGNWVAVAQGFEDYLEQAIDKAVEERDKEIEKLNNALTTCAMCDSHLFVACPKCGELTKPKL